MLINLPFPSIAGPLLAWRRTPHVGKQYAEIGFSPLAKWSHIQGKLVIDRLNEKSDSKHFYYLAHRYSPTYTTEAALEAMKRDGITRAVAYSAYPQYSCTTTGSSITELWRLANKILPGCEWSVIDRWWTRMEYIDAVLSQVLEGLSKIAAGESVHLVFSAHSLPMITVMKGDQYVIEIAATCMRIMERLREKYPSYSHVSYTMAWQSKVGPLPWMGPSTSSVIKHLGSKKEKNVLLVPVGFISDHIETLHEIDHQYADEAKKSGILNFLRAPSLNDNPLLINAMVNIFNDHMKCPVPSSQYRVNCSDCRNPSLCRKPTPPL